MFTNVESTELISNVRNIMDELERRLDPAYVEAQENAEVDGDNVIQHKGLKLCKVEREAREGDYVRPTVSVGSLKSGVIYGPAKKGDYRGELVVKASTLVYWNERTPSTVEVFEVIGHCKPVEYEPPFPEVLTPNEQRTLLIKQAQEFVEIKSQAIRDSSELVGGYSFKRKENPNYCLYALKVEFVVNIEKRTVVALLKTSSGNSIKSKGIAKCAPDDVFNEHIGQAIALARALEIDIPIGFLKAVQPDEIVVGHAIYSIDMNGRRFEYPHVKHVNKGKAINGDGYFVYLDAGDRYGKPSINPVILDDTNAEYNNA